MLARPALLSLTLVLGACQSLVGVEDKHLTTASSTTDQAAPSSARPPLRPAGVPIAGGGQTIAFGVRRFYLGTVDPTGGGNGVPDDAHWRKLGYDLDGVDTTSARITSSETGCTIDRTTGVEDGDDGRDNALGSGLLRYASSVDTPNPGGNTEQISYNDVEKGYRTLILELLDLGEGPDDPFVPGRLYLAADVTNTAPPKWDGTDVRPISAASVTADGMALNVFPNGYLRDGTWVSGDESALGGTLYLPFSPGLHPTIIHVPMKAGWITAKLSADRTSGQLGLGIVAPVDAIRKEADCVALLARGCDDSGASGYASLRGYALMQVQPDLSLGSTAKPDPKALCDGISLGAGGELLRLKIGPVIKENLASCPQAVCAH